MKPWVCIASGPSLTLEDVDHVRGKAHVLVVNDNFRLAPWADYLYAADANWWDYWIDAVWDRFEGELWTQVPPDKKMDGQSWDPTNPERYKLNWVRSEPGVGLCERPGVIYQGGNSGYQGLGLAHDFIVQGIGKPEIYLLGYDMCEGPKGQHWFGDHPPGLTQTTPGGRVSWIQAFNTIRPADYGLKIVNCSRNTALQAFPVSTIQQCLA